MSKFYLINLIYKKVKKSTKTKYGELKWLSKKILVIGR